MPSTATDRLTGASASVAVKAPCRVATTANIVLSGEQTIDGIVVAAGERVLVKNQSTASQNGIWVAGVTAWSRAKDFDGGRDVVKGTLVPVTDGTVNAGFIFKVTSADPIVIGSSSLAFQASTFTDIAISAFWQGVLDESTPEMALAALGAEKAFAKGNDINSTATAPVLTLGTDGSYFDVTGAASITSIAVAAGRLFMLKFTGTPTLTHHATNLNLPGGANIAAAAGDRLIGFATAANTVHVLAYIRASEAFEDLASATTTNIGATASPNVRVTGTTTITGFGTIAAGVRRQLRFASALTLTHNATSLILPNNASNIVTVAGDTCTAVSLGSGNWVVVEYQRASGQSVAAATQSFEFVSTAAITATALISITSLAAGYDYIFVLEGICPTTDINTLFMRVSEDNGSNYKSGASDYRWTVMKNGTGASDEADSEIEIGTSWGNDAGNSNFVEMLLINPNASGAAKMVSWRGVEQQDSPVTHDISGGGSYYGTTNAVNAAQFGWGTSYGTNTFKAQGNITVYRRKRS